MFSWASGNFYAPTMMLLMGMWMSLTKNPMKPWKIKYRYNGHYWTIHYHYAKAYSSGNSNLGELFPVWLCAPETKYEHDFIFQSGVLSPFDQPYGVLAELLQWLQVLLNLIHRIIQALWNWRFPSQWLLYRNLGCSPELSRMGRLLQLTRWLLDLRTTDGSASVHWKHHRTGQDTGSPAQWRVVTVRRCTAPTLDRPAPAAGKGNHQLVLSAASVLARTQLAGWLIMVGLGLVNNPAVSVGGTPVQPTYLLLLNSFDFQHSSVGRSSVEPLAAVIQQLPMWTLVSAIHWTG